MSAKQSLLWEMQCRLDSEGVNSFVDVVRRHSFKADAPAFVFLKNGESEDGILTFTILDERARSIASLLQNQLVKGDRAILLFPSGLNFIIALLGCLYAGVVAVPVSPPRRTQKLEKLHAIVEDCDAKLILTENALLQDLAPSISEVPKLQSLQTLAVDFHQSISIAETVANWQPPQLNLSSIAFLQYTSGSTGKPKGVAVTHANLLATQQMIHAGFAHDADTIGVGWLPFHHDMGLVGNVLHSLYLGIPCTFMPPMAFMQQPIRWLRTISKYRATTSGGPNFAYELCVKRISPDQMEGLDLSCWKVAFTGAEPVRAETLDRFSEKFSSVGFSDSAFYPCYGMAEATLFVTGVTAGQGVVVREVSTEAIERNDVVVLKNDDATKSRQKIVGCGTGRGDQRICIVDPDSKRLCADLAIGEIWITGSNVTEGYWNDPIATAESFDAYIADSNEGPFLRTGDLGFLDNGELFITGRRKELIIIKGRNLYPRDIEDAITACHPALNDCQGAAFAMVIDSEEKLIVVHEIAQRRVDVAEHKQILMNAREVIAENFDAHLHDFVLIKFRGIPKTTSGKIQRNLCRELYRQQALPLVELV
ncbi:MAG: fatty acyl-AMP ligase [Pseudomonadota bacterium]